MDESQESPKKILTAKFFDKVAEIDQVANTALANSIALQSELSTVQIDLKSLIESLQVNFDSGMQNVQTQINEVTNVVIEEQEIRKSETEALEQQIFAQEDQLQKDVKGNKAKTISAGSFSGNMRQKLRDTVKKNPTAFGFLAGGMVLTSLSGVFPQSGDKPKNVRGIGARNNKAGDETGDGTGDEPPMMLLPNGQVNPLWQERYGTSETAGDAGDANDGGGILPEGDDKEMTKGINTYKNDDKEMTKGINTYKNDDKEITEKKKFVKTVAFNDNEEAKEFKKEKIQIKNLLKYDPKDVVAASSKSYNEGGTGIAGFNEKTGKIEVMSHEELEAHKQAVLSTKAGYQPDGSYTTYAANTVYSQSMGFDDGPILKENPYSNNNSNNEVVDGGTTVIEGTTEVVDGGTVANNQRGEVRASTPIVKSANSPVTAVKLSESNSIKELAIGA